MTEVGDPWGRLYMMESLTYNLYDRATYILKEEEEEGGGLMRYTKSGRY